MINRITPNLITSLKPNQIVLFGSNSEGRHKKGMALFALEKCGAKLWQASGLQGQSYAIITKKHWWLEKSQPLSEIGKDVETFIEFAKEHQEFDFLVTKIGCSLAGWKIEEIAPLFKNAINVNNIKLPVEFWDILNGN